jgi:cold shock CspA family protein
MQTAIIILFNQPKGWGFLTPPGSKEEIFFHISNCVPEYKPQLGDRVEFEMGPPFKLGQRPQAIKVRAAMGAMSGTEASS